MNRVNLVLLIILILTTLAFGRRQRKPEPDLELTMQWKDLSLKTICEEEEWKAQFEPVREKFTKCLGLKKLIMDENDPDADLDRYSMFRTENNNPYCRIAKSWDSCTHILKGLNCIEPNSEEITRGSSQGFSGMTDEDKHYDPEDMNSMVKPYKTQCEMAKFAANYGPYGSHGMDYYGGMGMDYGNEEGEEGGDGGESGPSIPHADGDF